MPESEIVAKLGPPLRVYSTSHTRRDGTPATWQRWRYATASPFYPSLSVTVLSEKGVVIGVSAKHWDNFIWSAGESPATRYPGLPTLEELLD